MSKDLARTYNRIAEDWHADHLHDDWWIKDINTFIKNLPRGAHVLDVGCGSGVKARYLVDYGLKVTGVDISTKLLEIAKAQVPEGKFIELSMTDLDTLPERFEGVFAQASLLHIPKEDVEEVIQKMVRRLVPGGLLYVAVKEIREGQPDERVEKENDYGYDYERFFSYFTLDELERYFTNAGLQIISKLRSPNPSGKTVWLQIIGKK